MQLDIEYLKQWKGKTESRSDHLSLTPVAALSATLDRDDPLPQVTDVLPLLWHWLYFLPIHKQSELGTDGHPHRGGFLPPVPLPRRMWAGGRLQFLQPLQLGDAVTRLSTIANVDVKQGRSGSLVFVLVRHEISNASGVAIVEEHDIVYRDMHRDVQHDIQSAANVVANINAVSIVAPIKASLAPTDHAWQRHIHPDDSLLFRYSALTFNSHRIHYSRSYVTEIEAYPGLVVHGPLIATLLMDLLRRNIPDATVTEFNFRAVRPLFDTADFIVCGKPAADGKSVALWAKDADGFLAMEASATLL